ncbi:hypothetical protein [Roseiconus lacunae]|uniref:Uncharacterized protein n=1 Tax=Roseiconus lacunae TaxID=2605694 RepID=A0ABT7PFR9_9BACT|nr:hypothetical protein [Roseiconus lacunae]MCD0461441.1 hypothetical protein [Roseiconus lacunae]MDM4015340.1 hypothetical protein [Roseiconus lacunae]WRQ52982.1 hypothetical protein U8335_10595 [Stieleria sp. HD01]
MHDNAEIEDEDDFIENDHFADDFDYDEFVETEFGDRHATQAIPAIWRWVATGLLALILFYFLIMIGS